MGGTMFVVHHISRIAGAGGRISYHVQLQTQAGAAGECTFSGNLFVGPVALTWTDSQGVPCGVVIDEPRRFGEFVSREWVLRFFDALSDDSCESVDWRHGDYGSYRQTG